VGVAGGVVGSGKPLFDRGGSIFADALSWHAGAAFSELTLQLMDLPKINAHTYIHEEEDEHAELLRHRTLVPLLLFNLSNK
jgi:hypothetical protein